MDYYVLKAEGLIVEIRPETANEMAQYALEMPSDYGPIFISQVLKCFLQFKHSLNVFIKRA